jgi:hypothetical protein
MLLAFVWVAGFCKDQNKLYFFDLASGAQEPTRHMTMLRLPTHFFAGEVELGARRVSWLENARKFGIELH